MENNIKQLVLLHQWQKEDVNVIDVWLSKKCQFFQLQKMIILSLYVLFCSSFWCCLEMVTPRDVEWCGKRLGWIQRQHPRPWGRRHHLAKYVRKGRWLISVEVLGSACAGIYICVPVWAPWHWWPFQCRNPHLFLVTQTAVQKCSFWKRMIILFHFHIHTNTSTYTDFQAGVCAGTLIQKRICKTQNHSSQRAHLLTHLSLCFVQGSYFTFLQLHHLPFYFPVAIPTYQW